MYSIEKTQTASPIATLLGTIFMSQPDQFTGLARLPDPWLEQRHEIIVTQSQQHHLPIQPVGLLPAPTAPLVLREERHDWVVTITDGDPLFHDRDGFPIPQKCLADLKRIQRAGVDFDRIYAAHELPAGTVPASDQITAEMLTPGPSLAARVQSERQGRLAQTVVGMATLPLLGAGLLATTAVAGAATIGGALAGLDPILFGVNLSRGRSTGVWYYLTHWAYE